MKVLQAKSKGERTPEQLAKAAMKQVALKELARASLDASAKVTFEYMGISHTLPATPTVNVKTGQIMFHFGAVGANRLPFEGIGPQACPDLSVGLGGNAMTGLEIEGWQEIRTKYGLGAVDTDGEETLSAGESTD
jgi:hypothetical protein